MAQKGCSVASSGLPPAGLTLRLARGGLIAAATLLVAIWAHTSANGNVPGTAGLVTIWALSTAVAASLLARPASVRRIVLLLCSGQGVLHLLLALVAGHGERPPASATANYYATHSMLDGPPTTAGSAADLTQGLGGLAGEFTSRSGLLMVATHLVAAAVVGLWLAAGEKVLWAALTGLARAVSAGVGSVLLALAVSTSPVLAQPAPAWFDQPPIRLGRGRLVRCPRRGPPV